VDVILYGHTTSEHPPSANPAMNRGGVGHGKKPSAMGGHMRMPSKVLSLRCHLTGKDDGETCGVD
jgi:hypothetical protein